MSKIYFAGDFLSNTGPAIANRGYHEHISSNTYVCMSNSKALRAIDFVAKLVFSRAVIVSGISKFHLHAVMLANRLNKPTFYIMHGYKKYEATINQEQDMEMLQNIERKLLRESKTIICVSKLFSNKLKKDLPDLAHKITYINNGVNINPQISAHASQKPPLSVLSFGGGIPIKNNLGVCIAINKIQDLDITYTVVGERSIHGNQISEYPFVRYFDSVSHDVALDMISRHQLYIQNSDLETFGMAVVEAVAMQTNILISKDVGARSVINGLNSSHIIKDNYNIDEISRKIEFALKTTAKSTVYVKNHGWGAASRRLLKIVDVNA